MNSIPLLTKRFFFFKCLICLISVPMKEEEEHVEHNTLEGVIYH